MQRQRQHLDLKLKDYRRFTVTLMILASYLYMGAIINTYIDYSPDGKGLTILSFLAAFTAGWLSFRAHRLKLKLRE
ncbi:YrhC family protein [Lentibacillus sp.]|uniref:YrhC family protein n=1 Tax=Lentibacillus sp. TaxID=1925746 RepID=UPI002B4AFC76|nr:YrhC family protein [Lentibacillus sp.]HLS07606.1 YrhC family protein [Lentibacillus sp.]